MDNIAAELFWITHILHDLNALPWDSPTILYDYLSVIFLS